MVRSMTGYGKAVTDTGRKKLTVEIKSLNSKQLDISCRLPWVYKEKEVEIRNIISQSAGRGKIEIGVSYDLIEEEPATVININAVKSYFRQMQDISGEIGISPDDTQLMQIIMRLPESVKPEKPELTEEEWSALHAIIVEATVMLDNYRIEEGKAMEEDMRNSVSIILKHLDALVPFEQDRIIRIREKIESALSMINGITSPDKNRFEQELIYYLEKFDINEEKVRLRKHCEYFIETLSVDNANGRTLSFITQEMGREINTIGSKANDASIQKLVVMMKEELEKIKEMALNVL